MSINLVPLDFAIKINVPQAVFGMFLNINGCNVTLADHGQGAVISEWAVSDVDVPSAEILLDWQTDENTIRQYAFLQNKLKNKELYAQLDLIDLKSIRALRSNDTARLTELENEAILIRQQLLPTQ